MFCHIRYYQVRILSIAVNDPETIRTNFDTFNRNFSKKSFFYLHFFQAMLYYYDMMRV